MKIEVKSHVGQFAYILTAEVPDVLSKETAAIVEKGVASVGHRAVASEWEKAMVKKGYAKEGQKRDEIAWSEKAQEFSQEVAEKKLADVCQKEGLPYMEIEFSGRYAATNSALVKEAKVIFARHPDKAKVRANLALEPDAPEEEVVAAIANRLAESRRKAAEEEAAKIGL